MITYSFSHKGNRKRNDDFVAIDLLHAGATLLLVIDGMGGYDHGDKAAKIVAESIRTFLSTVILIDEYQIQKAINKANLALRQFSSEVDSKLGATLGGAVIQGSTVISFWVGDVKIYHFHNSNVAFESSPHTLINELMGKGSIQQSSNLSKYKHVVTRSVQGELNSSKVEFHTFKIAEGNDLVMVCSDGVHDILDAVHLQRFFKSFNDREEAISNIERRLLIDGNDNFSLAAATI